MTTSEAFDIWVEKLKEYDLYSEQLLNELGEKIKIAPFTMTLKQGAAFTGGLTYTIINKLCVTGIKLNQLMEETMPNLACDNRSLVRVLLIQHLSKSVMFEATNESWKVNRGEIYQFAPSDVILKLGERTLSLCMQYDIKLSEHEIAALLACDKDDSAIVYQTPLANIVKLANTLTQQFLARTAMECDQTA